MTSTTTLEIEQYYDRVLAVLDDLAPDVLNDLLEDLPDHLAEVAAEGDGSLIERLGEPEAYAAELRSAAGLEPAETGPASSVGLAERLQHAAETVGRLDVRVGALVGYPRLRDLVRAAQPGWWVLRGWLVATVLAHQQNNLTLRTVLVPRPGGNALLGIVFVLAGVVASVWFGRRSLTFGLWPRRIFAAAGLIFALWSAAVLSTDVSNSGYAYAGDGYSGTPADNAQDVYVYDRSGHLVPGARLYDQDGTALDLGNGYCSDGTTSDFVNASQYSYPLCPSDPGPFRAGPGAVPGAITTPSATPAPSAKPTPTVTAHSKPTTTK